MACAVLIRPAVIFPKTSVGVTLTPPLAVAYLAASLRRVQPVKVIDALGEGLDHVGVSYFPDILYRGLSNEEIVQRLPQTTQWIGISAMFSSEWPHVADLIDRLQRAAPQKPIVVGGEHATAMSDWILENHPAVRAVVRGEGEEAVVRLSRYFSGQLPEQELGSVSLRTETGEILRYPSLPRCQSLDELNVPAWDRIALDGYFDPKILPFLPGHPTRPTLPILASRGCPYRCTFCSSAAMWTPKYYLRTPARLVDELQSYESDYGVRNFQFFDLTAMVSKRWILEFVGELKERGLDYTFQFPQGTRSEVLDTQVLEALRKAGFSQLVYAPESGSRRILKSIKKRVNIPTMLQSMKEASTLGFLVRAHVIMGYPQETRASLCQTLFFLVRMAWNGVQEVAIFRYIPYPGSELFDQLKQEGQQCHQQGSVKYDRAFFRSLIFNDSQKISRACRRVHRREIVFCWWLGYLGFYLLSYLFYPKRIVVFLTRWIKRTPVTALETYLFDRVYRRIPMAQKIVSEGGWVYKMSHPD